MPFHLLALALHSFKSSTWEENQMISECYVLGTLPLYKRLHKRWIDISKKYWQDRNEIEYHEMLVRKFNE
jgi:hypothetical protein